MVVGLGLDLVELPRVERSLARWGDRLIGKLMDEPEARRLPPPGPERVLALALAITGKEAASKAIGTGWTTFPGRSADDLRRAIVERRTHHHGSFHGTGSQLSTFGRQLRKYGRDARATVRGRVLRDGSGRDLGFPGERLHGGTR